MNETKNKQRGRWKAGESGNPAGRKPGSGHLQQLRNKLAGDLPEILASLTDAAKSGDIQASKLILDRVLAPLKAIEQPVELELPQGNLTAIANALLRSAASGELAPTQAAQLMAALGTAGKITELDDLSARIKRLEERHAYKP